MSIAALAPIPISFCGHMVGGAIGTTTHQLWHNYLELDTPSLRSWSKVGTEHFHQRPRTPSA